MQTFEGKKVPKFDKKEVKKSILDEVLDICCDSACKYNDCHLKKLVCSECLFNRDRKTIERWLKTELLKEV